MRTPNRLLPKVCFFAALSLALVIGLQPLGAQDFGDVIPGSSQGSGGFFNRQLGTAFRFNYRTQGYGVQDDVFSLGGMKVFNGEGSTLFLDGQATLSDDFGGGFNFGVGYRQLINAASPLLSADPERINGIGFWTDGQSTSSDNFFTQLGFSLESLGESFDFRANGYFPLETLEATGAAPTITTVGGDTFFMGNDLLVNQLTMLTSTPSDIAHTVIEAEFAKRIADLEAWIFSGFYQIGSGGVDATGYRVGARGNIVPDVALSLEVTDDDQFATNVLFGVTWFVGRTHRGNAPTGTLLDRFREPVQRNNFVAMTQGVEVTSEILAAGSTPLTDAATGNQLRFVHVEEGAAGVGTFEDPVGTLAAAGIAASQVDDIVLVRSGSTLTDQFTALDGQRILGEGGGILQQVDTTEIGLINLPETSPGSQAGAVPVINAPAGDSFTLASNNQLNNFVINNGTRAVVATGVDSPELGNLTISNTTGDALALTNLTGTALVENTVTINGAGGAGVLVDGGAGTVAIAAAVTNTAGSSAVVQNRTGGTVTYSGAINDTGEGLLVQDNTSGTISFTNDLVFNVAGASNGVTATNNTGATVNFAGLDIQTVDGIGFTATGGGTIGVTSTGANSIATDTGVALNLTDVTIAGTNVTFDTVDVTNGATNGVNLQNLTGGTVVAGSGAAAGDGGTLVTNGVGGAIVVDNVANVTVNNVTIDNAATGGGGLDVINNAAGARTFNGVVANTQSVVAVDVNNNSDGSVTFTNLTADSSAGTISAVDIQDNTGSTIAVQTATVNTSDGTGLFVSNNTNANILLNDVAAMATGTGEGVLVDANVSGVIILTNLEVDTFDGTGVSVTNNMAAVNTTFDNFDIAVTGAGDGIVASGGGTIAATGTNNVTTETGIAANFNGVVIGPDSVMAGTPGFALTNVNVANGASNGVVFQDLTGGTVAVGNTTTPSVLITAQDAIVVTDAENVSIENVDVTTGAAGVGLAVDTSLLTTASSTVTVNDLTVAATGADAIVANNVGGGDFALTVTNSDLEDQVNISGSGGGDFDVTFNNSTVDTAGTDVAFMLSTSGQAVSATNLQIQNSAFTSEDALAFDLNADGALLGGVTGDITFELSDSQATNNSASVTAEIDVFGNNVYNATVTDNTFTNNGVGDNFDIASNDGMTVINLQMTGNDTVDGADTATLRVLGGSTFNIVNRDMVEANNPDIPAPTFIFDNGVVDDITNFGDIMMLP